MNRTEFMKELEMLLHDLPEQERIEAMQYYESYFDDAGPGREQEIIEELGSPRKVAETIMDGLNEPRESVEFTEQGFQDAFTSEEKYVPEVKEREHRSVGKTILIIIVAIFAIKICVNMLGGVLGMLVSIPFGLAGAAIGSIAGAFGLAIAGLFLGGVGVIQLFSYPGMGLLLMGGGFLCLALCLFVSVFAIWYCTKFLPWLVRKVVDICKGIGQRRKEA